MRLDRLLSIALFLSNRRRVLAREVATHFGVSLRTVYRDMRALMTAGFPIVGSAGDGYRLEQSAYLRPLALTDEEATLLVLSATAFGASVKSDVREALERAALELEGVLADSAVPRNAPAQATARRDDGAHRPRSYPRDLDALRERIAARIVYDDPRSSKRTTRTIEPLGLVSTGTSWWLIAYCRLRKDARAVRTDAIASWKSKAPFSARKASAREATQQGSTPSVARRRQNVPTARSRWGGTFWWVRRAQRRALLGCSTRTFNGLTRN